MKLFALRIRNFICISLIVNYSIKHVRCPVGVTVSTLDFESSDGGSNPSRDFLRSES